MKTRTTSATFLLSFLLLATAATASARPDILPTTSSQSLPGIRGSVLFSRVTPNSAIDVIFNNTDTSETWRWDVTSQSTYRITAVADYIKVGKAHGHLAATYQIQSFGTFDFRTNRFTTHSSNPVFPEGVDIHGNWIAWQGESGGIHILNTPTRVETTLFPKSSTHHVSLHGDWLTFRKSTNQTSETVLIQLSTMREHPIDPIPGVPHVGSGKLVRTEPGSFTWEYIGQPQTRRHITPPTSCSATRDHQLGGSRSQLLAYVAYGCASGEDELHVMNLNTERTFFVATTPRLFSFESNVIAYSDDSETIRVSIIDETKAK